jgi:hypothetical protein
VLAVVKVQLLDVIVFPAASRAPLTVTVYDDDDRRAWAGWKVTVRALEFSLTVPATAAPPVARKASRVEAG